MRSRFVRSLVVHAAVYLTAAIAASANGQETRAAKRKAIDQQRQELLTQQEQIRRDPMISGTTRLVRLGELSQKLFMLDYDDPRTRIGAAVAMQDASDDELLPILFDVVIKRAPKEQELTACRKLLAEAKHGRREAIHEIVWALCNTREFVELLKADLRRAGAWP
ncbi:MAG: hypothetical protein RIC55_23450 [Pirellulaceae bacterium]